MTLHERLASSGGHHFLRLLLAQYESVCGQIEVEARGANDALLADLTPIHTKALSEASAIKAALAKYPENAARKAGERA